jgi:N-acetylglucosamine-6-phosphate deacetylase
LLTVGDSPGLYKYNAIDVEVFPAGHLGLPGTGILAGAAHLLDWDIPVFMKAVGIKIGEAVRLCTVNPAGLLRLEPCRIEAGGQADLVFFRIPQHGALQIEAVFRRGKQIYPQENI